ncbi:MAG: indole-3-glycerol phosphate synthase TrpC [Magnetococcales bacterium]|nr:indole-3-glycerol phosphate synthase TrpC [Magnetococcales bacterium]
MHILDRIMARKREEVAERRAALSEGALLARVKELDAPRGFEAAIRRRMDSGRIAVIAEVKRASPSKGVIRPGAFDPAWIAERYAANGAACVSCLTDRDFFQGREEYVAQIRQRVELPVLRKDFLYDPYQVIEARAMEADAILLIMAVLSVPQAQELESAARELGLDVLVEVHDAPELAAAHELKTPLMGVNNRDLRTFVTSLETTERLVPLMESGRIPVAESGIHRREEVARLRGCGVGAFLIGEALMREEDPGAALQALVGE